MSMLWRSDGEEERDVYDEDFGIWRGLKAVAIIYGLLILALAVWTWIV